MTTDSISAKRIATMVSLTTAVPGQSLGRTALVQFMYFLQPLDQVPLGYDFRLSYGPYDADVLDDLATAKAFQALTEKTVTYSIGYVYEIDPGPNAVVGQSAAADGIQAHRSALDHVLGEFGSRSAADLELGSTILFVDRELNHRNDLGTIEAIASRVPSIQPHFPDSVIVSWVKQFQAKGWLLSVSPTTV